MKYNIIISVVLYKTSSLELDRVIQTFSNLPLIYKIIFIDNSPTEVLGEKYNKLEKVEYIFVGKNIGFGSGHNIAINKYKDESEYHLILNSDVDFKASIITEIYEYMNMNLSVGLLGPKVLNEDNTIQYSAKLLPTPLNLIVRRFIPIQAIKNKLNYKYELKFQDFTNILEVPYITGCFMFINTQVFSKIKGFDEIFFMYPEDIDLTRRINEHYKTIYYPKVVITHSHGKGSYESFKLLYYHISSMIKYFNKWGWFFDSKRKKINNKILLEFKGKS